MICLLIVLFIVGVDQFSKYLVVEFLKPIDNVPIIENVFGLSYAENTGAAFSIFENGTVFFSIVTIIITVVLIFVLYKFKPFWFDKIAFCMIIGGGLGNLIDRIFRGFVVDFFDFHLINFPIFNVADIFVCIGAALFIASAIFNKKSILYLFEDKKEKIKD